MPTMQSRQYFFLIVVNFMLTGLMYIHFQSVLEHLQEQNKRLTRSLRDRPLSDERDDNLDLRSSGYDESDQIVIYNRVPKTGSTSFMDILYQLCADNGFNVLLINTTRNMHTFTVPDQVRFAANITNWSERKPALYHGHMAYMDFTRLGVLRHPLYINVIREPLERLVSYYYFVRNGDDFRPHLIRSRMGDKTTFDECVEQSGRDCAEEKLWLQIPFFCGQEAYCWSPGNADALRTAKRHLVERYLLVGTTDNLAAFIATLELSLPSMFQGSYQLFTANGELHKRKTRNKAPVSEATLEKLAKSRILQMEREFYEFAKRQFVWVQKKLYRQDSEGRSKPRGQQYRYIKVRPNKAQEL